MSRVRRWAACLVDAQGSVTIALTGFSPATREHSRPQFSRWIERPSIGHDELASDSLHLIGVIVFDHHTIKRPWCERTHDAGRAFASDICSLIRVRVRSLRRIFQTETHPVRDIDNNVNRLLD